MSKEEKGVGANSKEAAKSAALVVPQGYFRLLP